MKFPQIISSEKGHCRGHVTLLNSTFNVIYLRKPVKLQSSNPVHKSIQAIHPKWQITFRKMCGLNRVTFWAASLKAIPLIATLVTVEWSIRLCMYVLYLSHSSTLLKPLAGMRCHVAGIGVFPSDQTGDSVPSYGEIWARRPTNSSQRCNLFRLLPNNFGACWLIRIIQRIYRCLLSAITSHIIPYGLPLRDEHLKSLNTFNAFINNMDLSKYLHYVYNFGNKL